VTPVPIVVVFEIRQFSLEIALVPEECFVETLAANGADESFHERM
jgi:hypothetical protein